MHRKVHFLFENKTKYNNPHRQLGNRGGQNIGLPDLILHNAPPPGVPRVGGAPPEGQDPRHARGNQKFSENFFAKF
jgi:hypothetical protein